MTHYETLNVAPDATHEQIKAGYRRASSKAHPDRDGGSDEKMAMVNRAYQVLSDPAARSHYDETGDDPAPPEDGAAAILMELFERAIERCDGDIVAYCRDELKKSLVLLDEQEADAKREIRKLTKKRDRVKAKGDAPNLFATLIDEKVRRLEGHLRQIKTARENGQGAVKRLDDYESTFVPEPKSIAGREQAFHRPDMGKFFDEIRNAQFGFDMGRNGRRPW